MSKIIIDLAFASETGCLYRSDIASVYDFKSISPSPRLETISEQIEEFILSHRDTNLEIYIERPLQIGAKDTIEKFDWLCQSIRQFCKKNYLNCYTIDVGVWQNALAQLSGYKSKIDFDENSDRPLMLDIQSWKNRGWFTKGYKESKLLAMYAFEGNFMRNVKENEVITEDFIDCWCISEVAKPHMDGQQIKQEHKRATGHKIENRANKKLEIWKRELEELNKWLNITIEYKECAYKKDTKLPNKNAEKAMLKAKEKLGL